MRDFEGDTFDEYVENVFASYGGGIRYRHESSYAEGFKDGVKYGEKRYKELEDRFNKLCSQMDKLVAVKTYTIEHV